MKIKKDYTSFLIMGNSLNGEYHYEVFTHKSIGKEQYICEMKSFQFKKGREMWSIPCDLYIDPNNTKNNIQNSFQHQEYKIRVGITTSKKEQDCYFCKGVIQKGDFVYKIKCNHSSHFHHYCLREYLRYDNVNGACPICKISFAKKEYPPDDEYKALKIEYTNLEPKKD